MVSPIREHLNMSKVYFFGTSGGCLDAFYLNREIHGNSIENFFLSDEHNDGEKIHGQHVAGPFDFINTLSEIGCEFVYQCGSVNNHKTRDIWFKKAVSIGMIPRTLISKIAYIHPTALIGKGSIIYPGVKIMTNVSIGENCIVLPNTVINHDSHIGNYCIINTACVINGNVSVGDKSYIGSSTSIKEKLEIHNKVTIGMDSMILNSINKEGLYYGSPAKFIR